MAPVLVPNDANAYADLLSLISVEPDAIVTKTLYESGAAKLVLFAMDAGQRLSDHSATRPALVHMLDGQLEWSLAGERRQLDTHAWVTMIPGAIHAAHAITPSRFLLTLLKEPGV